MGACFGFPNGPSLERDFPKLLSCHRLTHLRDMCQISMTVPYATRGRCLGHSLCIMLNCCGNLPGYSSYGKGVSYFVLSNGAFPAATRAMGTWNAEQDTYLRPARGES